MTKFALPLCSTIVSIKTGLCEEYVRAVLENVQQCEREVGNAVVIIGLADSETRPNYRIDAVMEIETGQRMNWQNFSGRTHRPLTELQEKRSLWSTAYITHSRLSVLLGEIRGFQKVEFGTNTAKSPE